MKRYFFFLILPMIFWAQEQKLTKEEAKKILDLPLHCIDVEFPNKLSQTLSSAKDMGTPKELHPAFYGCFDWHSAVHGYWSIVTILKKYPELDKDDEIKNKLIQNLSKKNILKEVEYFERKQEYSYERTYGWAWLFKLQESLNNWDAPQAEQLSQNLSPLTKLLAERYTNYLPKLKYPIRVGTHTNTAFGMSLTYDYALNSNNVDLQNLIKQRAKDFYLQDANCPISWEPNGYDFLSPCMQELDLMRKVLPKKEFKNWVTNFIPSLAKPSFKWAVGEVSDRNDGHLVHLDGLNFSRAWVLYDLANQYREFEHLKALADEHFNYSYPNLIGDSYEGGHWLGTFALYAILKNK